MIDINKYNAEVNNFQCIITNMHAHELSLKVLNLLYLLVKYGYYHNLRDIHALMEPLISILSGMNDKTSSDTSSESVSKVHTYVAM